MPATTADPQINIPIVAGGNRQTQPDAWNPFRQNGIGLIPRRGIEDAKSLLLGSKIQSLAQDTPLQLLRMSPDWHPIVGKAIWDMLRHTTDPEHVRIVMKKDTETGRGSIDDDGTGEAARFFEKQPPEVGGLEGVLIQGVTSQTFCGMSCGESVPGRSGEGVQYLWPVDPLTIILGRDDRNNPVTPFQRQTGRPMGISEPLRPETFHWSLIDPRVDTPYGGVPFAPALAEIIADVALMQDLRDSVHHSAWPRELMGFPFETMFTIAVEKLNKRDPAEATAWVNEQFQHAHAYIQTLKADDWILGDSNVTSKKIGGDSYVGLSPILEMLRLRIVQALKSLPTLMGINVGSTETWSTVEAQTYAATLETVRSRALLIPVKSVQLHFRLLKESGLKAFAQVERIRVTDAAVEATTEATKTNTRIIWIQRGWIDDEEASIEMTGSGPVGEPQEPVVPQTTPPDNTNNPGASAEENNVQNQSAAFKEFFAQKANERRRRFEQEGPTDDED